MTDRRSGIRSLDELDQVGWGSLRHRGGTAGDVPAMLRALADPGRADEADFELWSVLGFLDDVEQATAPALRFILGLLHERSDLRGLLSPWLSRFGWVFEPREDAATAAAAEVRSVLTECLPVATELLADPDLWVRVDALGLIASCLPAAGASWPVLAARLATEPDRGLRSDLLLSLAGFAAAAGRRDETRALVYRCWASSRLDERVAAAQARCLLDPADPEPWPVLLGCLPAGAKLGRWWAAGWPGAVIDTLAGTSGGLATAEAREIALRTAAESGSGYLAGRVVGHLLTAVFGAELPAGAAELDPAQRQVIEALAAGRVAFEQELPHGGVMRDVSEALDAVGLPSSPEALSRWLAGGIRKVV